MARYTSRGRKLKIGMKPSQTKEIEGRVVFTPGHKIRFEDGWYETEDKNEINFLDNDPGCIRMQKKGVFAKVDEKAIEEAVKKTETTEERRKRLEAELQEIEAHEKAKLKDTVKTVEKGKTTKGKKKADKPQF